MKNLVRMKIWGPFAAFNRPDLHVESVSYPFPTPSAARGILDSIFFKPQMQWRVLSITLIRNDEAESVDCDSFSASPITTTSIKQNGIHAVAKPKANKKGEISCKTIEVHQQRCQKNALILLNVGYIIEACIEIKTENDKSEQCEEYEKPTFLKYLPQFQRRLEKGQCYHTPYLGRKEYSCYFSPVSGNEEIVPLNQNLGVMFYDFRFDKDGTRQPLFFNAIVKNGVLDCSPENVYVLSHKE